MRVIILPEVLDYLKELVIILYEKQYFSFLETSSKYVIELLDDIETDLPLKSHKPAPAYFDRYGKDMKYASFRKNKHTTWYIFFWKYKVADEIVYQIRYIANNHVTAQHL